MRQTLRATLVLFAIGLGGHSLAQAQPTRQTPPMLEQLANLTFVSSSLIKQSAYFEANQVVRRFFLCIPEASNHKLEPGVLENVEKCFNETVDDNIHINIAGNLSDGRASALAIATQGLASIRNSASFSLSAPYISQYTGGRLAGTGTIELNFNVMVHQNITAVSGDPKPFDPTPGPQLFVSNNTLGLKAVRPGQWRITLLKVDPLLTELSPNIQFNSNFPHYPIDKP
ncbi:MAG TPA: hypothetical protein VLG17_13835 [Pseudomonas sp.]|jgi:hypothetical protein|uniref:hypothetical protein n=1 Tax=Pseudomonas sp. TaxID=306 RepID=UPI002627F50C|nr:hypothetical protein [Pseudomonas sp.]HSX89058.1 hypothetical protein [Pseudomonas sp.]